MPGWLAADLAAAVPSGGGGLPSLSPPCPAFSLLSCPLSPRPPSPAGKGETKVISCKGLRPLHPRAEPKRRREQGRTTHPAGACPAGRRLGLPPLYPVGGACLLCRLPTLPLACFPAPLPRRGRIDPQPALAERSSRRHLLSLPRGRGPSQTPPSLATDSSISPGPPSPWLPALLIGKGFCLFCGEPRAPLCAGHLLGRFCKCRRRFYAGVPGAKPPAK